MIRLVLLVMFTLVSVDVSADSFRCGRKVIKSGESTNALIKKCGHPVRKYSGKETVTDQGRSLLVGVSNWVYERNGKKDMIVTVRSGAIVKMQVD